MSVKKNRKKMDHSGSTFDSFLEEEGIREEVEAVAIKRVLAWQLERAMQEQQKTKQAMAKQLARLFSGKIQVEQATRGVITDIARRDHGQLQVREQSLPQHSRPMNHADRRTIVLHKQRGAKVQNAQIADRV